MALGADTARIAANGLFVIFLACFGLTLLARRIAPPGRRWWVATALIAALLVALFVGQRLLSEPDERQIETAIEEAESGTDPAACGRAMTVRFLEQSTKYRAPYALPACEWDMAERDPDPVRLSEIEVDGRNATALIAYDDGAFAGSRVRARLVRNGGWRLDEWVTFERFDRPALERDYRERFLEFGSPAGASCAVGRLRSMSRAVLEAVVLGNDATPYAEIYVDCDREAAEKSMAETLAGAEWGLDPAAIECATRRARPLGDAQLAGLLSDPARFDRLARQCREWASRPADRPPP